MVLGAPSGASAGFDSPVFYTTATSPMAAAIADLDGDLDSDIAVVTAGALRILVNAGNGSFSARDQSGLWSHEAHDVTTADLDRDGDADLVVAMSGIAANGFPDGTGRIGVLF